MNNLDELKKQLYENEKKASKVKKQKSDSISQIVFQRNLLLVLTLLSLGIIIWLYLYQEPKIIETKIPNTHTLIRKDSLNNYISYYKTENLGLNIENLNKEKIIYYVQIGAFEHFKLSNTTAFQQFKEGELNKITIGTFSKYKKAKDFQEEIINLGFKDCFLTSKSYGKSINIIEALALSNEPQFLD